tara:strand:+ start:879 stop:1262 length:384 start_codon:yes stop_codon:yes gene_type:complete
MCEIKKQKFIELSTNKSIEYIDNNQQEITILLVTLKSTLVSFIALTTITISTITNSFISTNMCENILKILIRKSLTYERYLHRIKSQFDLNFTYPSFDNNIFISVGDVINRIYEKQLEEYICELELV